MAAVLGVVAGTSAGYLVQVEREPTRLPSLSQPVVKQAKGEVEPLSAAQDPKVRTDGDLRELLLKRPGNARDGLYEAGADGWLPIVAYADSYEDPVDAFSTLVADEFRRAAVTNWRVGNTYHVEVRLVQYRQEESLAAMDSAENAHYWADRKQGTRSWAIPGTGDGMAYVHDRPEQEEGVQVYTAEAHAWRGDMTMEIWVTDIKPISKEKIMDLAKRQVARL